MGADWQRTPCWVPVDADGKRLTVYEGTPHYESEADALVAITELGYVADDEKDIAGVKVLPQPCVQLTCDGCGEGYEDPEVGYGLHFADMREAMDVLAGAGWAQGADGRLHCWDCPPLTASPEPVEHVPGQLALDGTEAGEGRD